MIVELTRERVVIRPRRRKWLRDAIGGDRSSVDSNPRRSAILESRRTEGRLPHCEADLASLD